MYPLWQDTAVQVPFVRSNPGASQAVHVPSWLLYLLRGMPTMLQSSPSGLHQHHVELSDVV